MTDPVTAVRAGTLIWKLARPITRVKIALNRRRARKGKPLLEVNRQEDAQMLAGALKSKTVWFGIATEVWGVTQVFLAGGDFSAEALFTLGSGIVIIVLRAVTKVPLGAK